MISVRAFAPATVGNIICGLDVLGLALEAPGDLVEARTADRPGVTIAGITGSPSALPLDPERNTASVAAAAVLRLAGARVGLELWIEKGLAPASGLGSSAASAAAAVAAVDRLLELGLGPPELLACAAEGERAACGAAHLDNVAPALLGGVILLAGGTPPRPVRLHAPGDLVLAIVRPHMDLPTGVSRSLLPPSVPLATATRQAGRTAAFAAAMASGDWDLLRDALADELAEPLRAPMVPAFHEVRAAAMAAGAAGCGLSGSGPSMVALCRGRQQAEDAAERMAGAVQETGMGCDRIVSGLGGGVRIADGDSLWP